GDLPGQTLEASVDRLRDRAYGVRPILARDLGVGDEILGRGGGDTSTTLTCHLAKRLARVRVQTLRRVDREREPARGRRQPHVDERRLGRLHLPGQVRWQRALDDLVEVVLRERLADRLRDRLEPRRGRFGVRLVLKRVPCGDRPPRVRRDGRLERLPGGNHLPRGEPAV